METKTKYNIDLNIPQPSDLNITAKSPTLKELEEYRLAWLDQAKHDHRLEDLFTIARALCQPENPWGSSLRIGSYPRFNRSKTNQGILTIILFTLNNNIIVTLGGTEGQELATGKRVANIHESLYYQGDDFWIPGPWVAKLSGLNGMATDRMIDIRKAKGISQRAELITRLGLGGKHKK